MQLLAELPPTFTTRQARGLGVPGRPTLDADVRAVMEAQSATALAKRRLDVTFGEAVTPAAVAAFADRTLPRE